MTADTMQRIRVTIDCSDAHKRAFHARAQFEGISPQELFEKFVERYCPDELERANEMMKENKDEPKKKPGKK